MAGNSVEAAACQVEDIGIIVLACAYCLIDVQGFQGSIVP